MLEALGNLGDFIGGIAVVATLLYLAVQVRQNTVALRTASRQQIVAGFREYNRLLLQPGNALAYGKGMRSYPDLPFDERQAFSTMVNDHALFFQGAFALHEAGTLEEATYIAYLEFFAASISTPGGMVWWDAVSPLYAPRMVAAVKARLVQGGLPDLLEGPVFALDDFPPGESRG